MKLLTNHHLEIDITDEEIEAYCNRPEIHNFTDEQRVEFVHNLKRALFDNGFWDIAKVVLMEMEDNK